MLKRLNAALSKMLYWVTALSCTLFLVVVLAGILTRFVLKQPLLSSVELSRLFFLWSCFSAAALGFYKKAHIAITFITDRFSARWFKPVEIFVHGLETALFGLIFITSLDVVQVLWSTDLPMLGYSQAWLYLPVPFASGLMLLFAIEFLVESIKTPADQLKDHALDPNR